MAKNKKKTMDPRLVWALRGVILLILIGIYEGSRRFPNYLYQELIHNRYHHALYTLPRWDQRFLTPPAPSQLSEVQDEFSTLWREFHMKDVVIPLPAGHPMFQTIPLIQTTDPQAPPLLGILFRSPSGREMSRIFLIKNGAWNDHLADQELFRLPLIRRLLQQHTPEETWRDMYSKDILKEHLGWREMVYNLYLLYLRATELPDKFLQYSLVGGEKKAIVELESKNKDYRTEVVQQFENGLILSYLIVSDTTVNDSVDLRSRFLDKIAFRTSDPALSQLIYNEFKQLSFNRQTDQEGMLYLFSAWSQDMNRYDMLKEMIYFLERGEKNHAQLKPLYRFALTKYQKTFTSRDIGLDDDDPDVRLQRLIELEAQAEQKKVTEKPLEPPPPPPTPRESMDSFLQKAREEKLKAPKRKGRATF